MAAEKTNKQYSGDVETDLDQIERAPLPEKWNIATGIASWGSEPPADMLVSSHRADMHLEYLVSGWPPPIDRIISPGALPGVGRTELSYAAVSHLP